MVYNSLTDVPRDFREGIDWLIALKGTDAESNIAAMGEAVYNFLVDKPVGHTEVPALQNVQSIVKGFLEQPGLKNVWPVNRILEKYNKRINKNPGWFTKAFGGADECDYKNVIKSKHVSAKTIAGKLGIAVNGYERLLKKVKTPEQYKSAYSSEATWEASCSQKPEDCAVVLVGIAPMLYAGLRSMWKASHGQSFSWVPKSKNKNILVTVLRSLGFKHPECRDKMSASYVSEALENVTIDMLETFYNLSGFWAFYGSGKIGAVGEKQPVEPVIPEAEPSVEGEGEQSLIPEAEPSVDGEGEQSMIPEAEPSFDGEGEQSVIPEAEPSFDGEGEQSLIPEAEPSVEGEGEQSVIPEAEPTFEGEGEQSVIPEAEPTFEGEGEQSVIPEAEPSVEPAGEEPVVPEAEPSVEPVKPEVDEVEQPMKVAKAAKVARSVKAAKKAAKKVSKKARQKKQKKQQESAEQ
ncbi:hypothetical protein BBBOND_0307360 [Babesia bigemina]|uniref:Uncharacterized protein n=1 Tax=Babesia bigemina TaxID=5866 RepID=A0A061DA57_BABBI|nr:hypothetical protein BBBOND_0307360 [Babesia bigemina]CDR96832.1 hypothetical protein BBBOND_0307360 [Babesia bigemina]|eukprot:XP_012769018.1 hypothetical protein BBBOND_0307360 [Babesia bigemina]